MARDGDECGGDGDECGGDECGGDGDECGGDGDGDECGDLGITGMVLEHDPFISRFTVSLSVTSPHLASRSQPCHSVTSVQRVLGNAHVEAMQNTKPKLPANGYSYITPSVCSTYICTSYSLLFRFGQPYPATHNKLGNDYEKRSCYNNNIQNLYNALYNPRVQFLFSLCTVDTADWVPLR